MLKLNYRRATLEDIPELHSIINDCYRLPADKENWTSEASWLEGDRIQAEHLQQLIFHNQCLLLACHQEKILGCCLLENTNRQLLLGMLSVRRGYQNQGIGKALIQQACYLAFHQWQGERLSLWVLSPRQELITYYQRHGFELTDDFMDFPSYQGFGMPKPEFSLGLTLRRMQYSAATWQQTKNQISGLVASQ